MEGKLIGYFKGVQSQFHGLKSICFHYHQRDKCKAILHCFHMLLLYREGNALYYVKVDAIFSALLLCENLQLKINIPKNIYLALMNHMSKIRLLYFNHRENTIKQAKTAFVHTTKMRKTEKKSFNICKK